MTLARLRPGARLECALLALLACLPLPALAATLQELQAQGRLQIDSSVTPTEQLVPGQKVILTLQIATDRWFNGGTRIVIPEVPGLVILQTEQFASNASENRAGQSWVIQRWNLDIYPQRAGDFSIPPIELSLKVNAQGSNNVEGKISTPGTRFSVSLPEALQQADQWVAAPSFTVSQHFDKSLEGLRPGDAFEREIVFEAEDVMAMMLPEVRVQALPGLRAYPAPPALDDSNNRGRSRARRTQSISYVVETNGEYRLPSLEFFWWDTGRSTLQLLSLPETVITVGTGVSPEPVAKTEISRRQVLLSGLGLGIALAALWLARSLLSRLPLARIKTALSDQWRQLLALRKPALPDQLNPGSSAAERKASG